MSGNSPTHSADSNNNDNPFVRLQEILLSDDRQRLDDLANRLDRPVDDVAVGKILPQAIRSSEQKPLAEALGPTVSAAIRESVQQDPQPLVDAVSPIIGPAIRRAISQAMRSMMQTFNRTLEDSFSLRGLQWRWEAWRTGTSFAHVVLLHTLVYEVDHVFLIHGETGLLLHHLANQTSTAADPNLVSGMLTAIESFVQDSFGAGEDLEKMDCGDRTVWVEKGRKAYLAASIYGHAPESYRERLQESLDQIHHRFGGALSKFKGDAAPFQETEPHLANCLSSEFAQRKSKSKFVPYVLTPCLILLALAGIGWGGVQCLDWYRDRYIRKYFSPPSTAQIKLNRKTVHFSGTAPDSWIRQAQRQSESLGQQWQVNWAELKNSDRTWLDFVKRLRQTPGYVVVHSEVLEDGQYVVKGLRDPLALDFAQLLAEAGIDPNGVTADWQPYESLDTSLAQQRTLRRLALPEGVQLQYESDGWRLTGTAPADWISSCETLLRAAGVSPVDRSELKNADANFQALVESLRHEPGIVLSEARRVDGVYRIVGLRDPLARTVEAASPELDLPLPLEQHWTPFYSTEPDLVLKRANEVLQPPDGVTIAFASGVLQVAGEARHAWIRRLQQLDIMGVSRWETDNLMDLDQAYAQRILEALDQEVIGFQPDKTDFSDATSDQIDQIVRRIQALERIATGLDCIVTIRVVGYTSASAPFRPEALTLAQNRANNTAQVLRTKLDETTVRITVPQQQDEPLVQRTPSVRLETKLERILTNP